MEVSILRYALDRVPLSLIIDDSTVLLNANYFWMRDRNPVDGQNRRWEDVPVVHPRAFTREWAELCQAHGVRGKFSVIPCPAAVGRIDHGLPLFSRAQQDDWLAMCRELIVPAFDLTPEMMTHSVVVDPATCRPVEPQLWEQYDWAALPEDEDLVTEYIAAACRILVNVGLTPTGVTSPGGFGGQTLDRYARCTGEAVRAVTGVATPYFFQRVTAEGTDLETPVWFPDRAAGTATGEIIASTGDKTGSWTGYGEADADYYLTADLQGGRLPELLAARQPVVFCSHWQGFYGLHDEDRRGFRVLGTVLERLRALDPDGSLTRWRKCSEITNYACAREMARLTVEGQTVDLDLPVTVPEFTLVITGAPVSQVTVNEVPLTPVATRAAFRSGTYLPTPEGAVLAFDAAQRHTTIRVLSQGAPGNDAR